MSSFSRILHQEIDRIARRSQRAVLAPLRRDIARLKRAAAAQRRTNLRFERDIALLKSDLAERLKVPPSAPREEVERARLSPRRILAQRKRLGLSREAFASLLGASPSAVSAWETGRSKPRDRAKATLVAVRKLGRRAAHARLQALARPERLKDDSVSPKQAGTARSENDAHGNTVSRQ